jgi:hypothetical protein
MALYSLEGVDKKTLRKRVRTYRVACPDDAIAKASEEHLIVDTSTIQRVFPLRHFHTKIAGVTFKNEDGSSRQGYLEICAPGDQLGLLRDTRNAFSEHAVGVYTPARKQLG